jgi:hypothetical protein
MMSQNLQSQPTKDHSDASDESTTTMPVKPQDSYVKLAMRNMVRKSGTSLRHFALTSIGLLAALVGLAYLFR